MVDNVVERDERNGASLLGAYRRANQEVHNLKTNDPYPGSASVIILASVSVDITCDAE